MAGYRWRGNPLPPEFSNALKPNLGIVPANKKPDTFDPALCGTPEGWWQHRRLKVEWCAADREDYNEYQRAYRAKKKAKKAQILQSVP